MRRSARLFPAALLGLAAATIGSPVSAAPPKVLVRNVGETEVLLTVTDLNGPHGGVILTTDHPLDANANLFLSAKLDARGTYHLHWKAQDPGRTKEQEGDCQGTPVFPCRIQLFFS